MSTRKSRASCARDVALFRYSLIRPLADPALTAAELRGTVVDDRSLPLAGAVISALGGTSAFAVSDRNGRFTLRELPAGPYLVIPIIGPSNPRDGVGLFADSAASVLPWFVQWEILFGVRAAEIVNTRALLLQEIDEAKQASFDYYVFVRNAYLQRRNALVNDSVGGTNLDQEELYHPEMGGGGDELYHPEDTPSEDQGGSAP